MALDRPFDDGRLQTANVATRMSLLTVSTNIMDDLSSYSGRSDLCVSDISDIDETAEMGVSD